MQFQLAERSATLLIFLGKQYLGQSDNPVAESKTGEILTSLAELVRSKC